MIEVSIKLFPLGDRNQEENLGVITIWNDLSGDTNNGNYKYKLTKRGNSQTQFRIGELKNFPRKKRLAYDLLYRVLEQEFGERNK